LTWITPQRHWLLLLDGLKAGPVFFELLRHHTVESETHSSVRLAYDAVATFLRHSREPSTETSSGWVAQQLQSGPPVAVDAAAAGLIAGNVVLTRREADVLAELALGDSYLEIGRTLYVTENTVKTHVAAIYRKLGSNRRAEALRRARALGLL
jgi:DNA-binding CsgD family transcriptional regulator